MPHTRSSHFSVNPSLQQPEQVTFAAAKYGKISPSTPPPRLASPQPAPQKKQMRPAPNGQKSSLFTKSHQKQERMRQKVKLYIWVDPSEKGELRRLAESEGLSLSQTGRAIIVDGIRQRLRIEREVLATPVLEAFFDKKMNIVINRLSKFLGRNVFETGQLRWLYVNTLYREKLRQIAAEQDPLRKKKLHDEFYRLLDTSQKETVKAVKQWNPHIKSINEAIKRELIEGESL